VVHDPALIALWRKIRTQEDPGWTRRYHSLDPREKAFGGRAEIRFTDGKHLSAEINVADAHPLGARPFSRPDYVRKFQNLTGDLLGSKESERFLETVQRLSRLQPEELGALNLSLPSEKLTCATRDRRGIF